MSSDDSKNMKPIIQQLQQNIKQNKNTQLYKVWPGKQRFFCFGNFMTGPIHDLCQNLYTWITILGAGLPYMIFVAPIVFKEVTPIIPVINGILFFGTILNLILTSFTNPGIIPRKPILLSNGRNNDEYILEKLNDIEQSQKTQIDERTFCYTCQIWRSPRASHCSDCDSCIEVLDHHCPFVNNCVGKRNYQYFLCFITCLCFLILSVIVGLVAWGIQSKSGSDDDDDKNENNVDENEDENVDKNDNENFALILIFGIPLGLIGLILIGFFLFHIYLAISGKTTREKLKNKNVEKKKTHKNNIICKDPTLFNPTQLLTLDEEQQLLNFYNDSFYGPITL